MRLVEEQLVICSGLGQFNLYCCCWAIAISTPSLSRRDRPSKTPILEAITPPHPSTIAVAKAGDRHNGDAFVTEGRSYSLGCECIKLDMFASSYSSCSDYGLREVHFDHACLRLFGA
jgi:hypothetical protein